MPATFITRPTTGRCRECRSERSCFAVRKMQGGGYNRAPHQGSAMLCVECVMDFAPAVSARRTSYIGAGRWNRMGVLIAAHDLYLPLTPAEAAANRPHAAHT